MKPVDLVRLRKERGRGPLAADDLPVACRGVGHKIVVQAFVPFRPIVGDVLVLWAYFDAAHCICRHIPLAAVVAAVKMTKAARFLGIETARGKPGERAIICVSGSEEPAQ